MNGIKYLLDTNIIIGVLKGNEQAVGLTRDINLSVCAFSAITRMELLGFAGITEHEKRTIKALLANMTHLNLNAAIEDATILLRQHRQLKLPDAMIVATATVYSLDLITLDKQLKVFSRIARHLE